MKKTKPSPEKTKPGAVPKKKKKQPKKSTPQAGPAWKKIEAQVSHYRSALGRALYDKRKVEQKMNESQKKALLAVAAAAAALAAAAQALAESSPEPAAAPEAPKTEEKKKPGPKPKEPEPAKPPEEKKPEPPAEKSIMDKVRDAVKEYAGINGREAVRALLDKYAPGKTVADIPAEKLPEFLKDLGG